MGGADPPTHSSLPPGSWPSRTSLTATALVGDWNMRVGMKGWAPQGARTKGWSQGGSSRVQSASAIGYPLRTSRTPNFAPAGSLLKSITVVRPWQCPPASLFLHPDEDARSNSSSAMTWIFSFVLPCAIHPVFHGSPLLSASQVLEEASLGRARFRVVDSLRGIFSSIQKKHKQARKARQQKQAFRRHNRDMQGMTPE